VKLLVYLFFFLLTSTGFVPNHQKHFIIITQARSLSSLLDELLCNPELKTYSCGELFNPKANRPSPYFSLPFGKLIGKSLAVETNERKNISFGTRLSLEEIVQQTIKFFENYNGVVGYKLLYEPIGPSANHHHVGREEGSFLPYFYEELTNHFGKIKFIFLFRDAIDIGFSNYEARALHSWSQVNSKRKSTKFKKLKLNQSEAIKLIHCIRFSYIIHFELQKEFERLRQNFPSFVFKVSSEKLGHSQHKREVLRNLFAFLLEKNGTDIQLPEIKSQNIQGRSALPFPSRYENWPSIAKMLLNSHLWKRFGIPECKKLLVQRFKSIR